MPLPGRRFDRAARVAQFPRTIASTDGEQRSGALPAELALPENPVNCRIPGRRSQRQRAVAGAETHDGHGQVARLPQRIADLSFGLIVTPQSPNPDIAKTLAAVMILQN